MPGILLVIPGSGTSVRCSPRVSGDQPADRPVERASRRSTGHAAAAEGEREQLAWREAGGDCHHSDVSRHLLNVTRGQSADASSGVEIVLGIITILVDLSVS